MRIFRDQINFWSKIWIGGDEWIGRTRMVDVYVFIGVHYPNEIPYYPQSGSGTFR